MGYSHTSQINYRMYLFTSEHVTTLRCTWHWPTRCREAQWCRQPCTVPPTWPKTENQKPQWTAKSEKKNVRKYDLIIVITCYYYSHWYIYIYICIRFTIWQYILRPLGTFPKVQTRSRFSSCSSTCLFSFDNPSQVPFERSLFWEKPGFYSALWAPKNDGSCWTESFGKNRWKEVLGRIRSHVKKGRWSPIFWKSTWQWTKNVTKTFKRPLFISNDFIFNYGL